MATEPGIYDLIYGTEPAARRAALARAAILRDQRELGQIGDITGGPLSDLSNQGKLSMQGQVALDNAVADRGRVGDYGAMMKAHLASQAARDKLGQLAAQEAGRSERQEKNLQNKLQIQILGDTTRKDVANIGADARRDTATPYGIKQLADGRWVVLNEHSGQKDVNDPTLDANGKPVDAHAKAPAPKTFSLAEVEKLSDMTRDASAALDLVAGFKPEYAMEGLGPLAGAASAGERGAKGWAALLPGGSPERADWWRRHSRVLLPDRHQLFGSAFTPSEQRIYDAAQRISPGMSAKAIKAALDDLYAMVENKRRAWVRGRMAEGYSPEALREYTGLDVSDTGATQPVPPALTAPDLPGLSEDQASRRRALLDEAKARVGAK